MPTNLASGAEYATVGQKRWVWPGFALPGVLWLILLFLVPFYAVFAIAMGQIDPILQRATPEWNPFYWDLTVMGEAFAELFGGQLGVIALRTLAYVFLASLICVLVGYPVAYFVSRKAGRWRWLWLLLILAPFWINYLMRMMSWVNLLSPDGQVNRWLTTIAGWFSIEFVAPDWLAGNHVVVILGLVYGYVPYMIIPLYAGLDRLPSDLIESARDLGANRFWAFWRVTWPMSRPVVVASVLLTCLPMLGDYFTSDLLSGSPSTSMVGNLINNTVLTPGQTGQAGAFVLLVLLVSLLPMIYYVRSVSRNDGALA